MQLRNVIREFSLRVYLHLPRFLRTLLKRARFWLQWARWKLLDSRTSPEPGLLVNESELRPQYRSALLYLQEKMGTENIGDYLEFGVCHGTTLSIMYDELLRAEINHVRIFGFDSFDGLPEDDEGEWKKGAFRSELDDVVRSLDSHGIDWGRVTLVKGFFSDTLTDTLIAKHDLRKVSLIMIDCDMYSSTKEALEFCGPLILDEAVIVFDDWNPSAKYNKGEKRAFDEFLGANPELEAVETGVYSYLPGDLHGKVFRVSRTRA